MMERARASGSHLPKDEPVAFVDHEQESQRIREAGLADPNSEVE